MAFYRNVTTEIVVENHTGELEGLARWEKLPDGYVPEPVETGDETDDTTGSEEGAATGDADSSGSGEDEKSDPADETPAKPAARATKAK